jgi:hypothetical protein
MKIGPLLSKKRTKNDFFAARTSLELAIKHIIDHRINNGIRITSKI